MGRENIIVRPWGIRQISFWNRQRTLRVVDRALARHNESRRSLSFATMSMITGLTSVKLVSDFIKAFDRETRKGKGKNRFVEPRRYHRASLSGCGNNIVCYRNKSATAISRIIARIAGNIRWTWRNIFAVRAMLVLSGYKRNTTSRELINKYVNIAVPDVQHYLKR